jgi:hypothetical protein
MMPLTATAFAQWLAAYGQASAADDPLASARLFSEDARYYESPFDAPLVGRRAIYDYWAAGAQNLTGKSSTGKILAVRDNLGIARWRSRFVVRATGAAVALDCIFLAEFDAAGLCYCFREWWHSRADDLMCEAFL